DRTYNQREPVIPFLSKFPEPEVFKAVEAAVVKSAAGKKQDLILAVLLAKFETAAHPSVVRLLALDEELITWHVAQALDRMREPPPAEAVPVMLRFSNDKSLNNKR